MSFWSSTISLNVLIHKYWHVDCLQNCFITILFIWFTIYDVVLGGYLNPLFPRFFRLLNNKSFYCHMLLPHIIIHLSFLWKNDPTPHVDTKIEKFTNKSCDYLFMIFKHRIHFRRKLSSPKVQSSVLPLSQTQEKIARLS